MSQIHKNSLLWDYIDPIIIDTLWEYDIELVKSMPRKKRDFLLMQVSDLIYEENLLNQEIQYQPSESEKPLDELLYDRVVDVTQKVFEYYN